MVFSPEDKRILNKYFQDLNKQLELTPKDRKNLIKDFKNIIDYYAQDEKDINKILEKIPISKLGDAYKAKDIWYPLDNSAKIYPFSMNHNWMSTFRISYYLKEDIIPEVLQIALLYTIKRFPTFKTSIRKGFFWYYMDTITKRIHISEENTLPVSNINISNVGKVPFKVYYFRNRISVEFFHMLTDGTGGLIFTTTLVNEYIRLLGNKVSYNYYALDPDDEVDPEEVKDQFIGRGSESKSSNLISSNALKIDGKKTKVGINKIIHYDLDANKLHKLAKENECTVNEFVTAIIFHILARNITKSGEIKIQIPVNLRKYYDVKTMRNFALYDSIVIDKDKCNNIKFLVKEIHKQCNDKLSKDKMDGMITESTNLVSKLNLIPIFLKKTIAYIISNKIAERGTTTVFSNLGRVDIPKELSEKVIKGDFILGTTAAKKELFSLITINDIATLTMCKFSINNKIELDFYEIFKEYGILVDVHGSDNYDNKA